MSDSSNSLPHSGVPAPDDDRTDTTNDDSQLSFREFLRTFMDLLFPNVLKRVEYLKELQKQFDKLQAEYFVEQSLLRAKYEELYEEFYQKRYEIVNGIKDVENTDEADKFMEVKGIPKFWLAVMKSNEKLGELITKDDEGALEYLKDIKSCRIDHFKGFKLEFFFSRNPYFKNSVLEKTYTIDKAGPVFIKAKGTEIEWRPRKCLTSKIEEIQKDYELGCVIRDQIIPQAVSWFAGSFTDTTLFVL
ncbi:nucleosome assembly protein 1-like 1 [Vigna unguiculata]|uniref:Nucleosome assembly protein 1-like 1 n=1 Tax=Vigna unguiculata TaxID=3917 RepID=A0A4D6N8C4_VIGUN|nr:nucleosome assembly protein 1-like 1 [Vigna unguiculata]